MQLHKMERLILATLFFEPSTRTRLSLRGAPCNAAGRRGDRDGRPASRVFGIAKGESLADTVRSGAATPT